MPLMARTVSSERGAAAVLGPTGESTESSLDSLIERARRQPTLAPSGWNGFPHDDKDMRSRLFEWLGELAGILPRDEEGDKGSSHNAELIMAFSLLDRCAGPLS